MDLEDLLHGAVDVVLTGRFGVEDLDREGTTRNSEARCIAVELRELRIYSVKTAIKLCNSSPSRHS